MSGVNGNNEDSLGSYKNPKEKTSSTKEKYAVNTTLMGYLSASEAIGLSNPVNTVKPGNYFINAKDSNGAINLYINFTNTYIWINPRMNKVSPIPNIGGEYNIVGILKGYSTALNAIHEFDNKSMVIPGTYFVHDVSGGAVNISHNKHTHGVWIKLADNVI